MTRPAFSVFVVAVALALLAWSERVDARCVMSRPEAPVLVTPTGSQVPPGGVVVLYLSADAEAYRYALVPDGTQTRIPLTRRALSPRVYALEIPASAAAGPHTIEASRPDRGSGGPYSVGAIVVGGALPTRSLPAPRGRLTLRESTSERRGTSRSIELSLASPPSDVAIVMRWAGGEGAAGSGNARWVIAGEEISMVHSGRCGTGPFGASVPGAGARVEVAYVDARGVLGPWASLVVER